MKRTLLLSLLGSAALWNFQAQADDDHDHDHDHGHSHAHVERWTAGHGDIGIVYEEGVMGMHLHVSSGAVINGVTLTEDRELEADEARIIVAESARQLSSAELEEGTGVAEGEPMWVLPGTHSHDSPLPFLGLATEDLDPADWTGDLNFNLHEVVSPSGQGHFAVYTADGLGGYDFLMSTAQGGITAADLVALAAGGHAHYFMSFSEPGTWRVSLTASGVHGDDGEVSSEPVTYVFEVGEKPARWTAGHGDIGLAYEDGELDLHLHLHEGAVLNGTTLAEDAEPSPSMVEIVVSNVARMVSTEELEEGTGAHEGETLWVLPVVENPQLPFLGFGTEELDPADWTGDLTFTLVGVESPSGEGHFSAFTSDGLGGFDFPISTHDGGISAADHLDQAAGTHNHVSLAFTEPGRWLVTFVATGTHVEDGPVTSVPVTYVFEVGTSTWTSGHGDIGVAYHDGELEVHLHLHEGAVVDGTMLEDDLEPDPATTLIAVSNAAIVTSTEELEAGTGVHEGENLWVLPATNRAGLPFLGLGAEELDPADWTGDIRLSLAGVSSPSGTGHFAVYQADGLGGYDFAMSTALGGITAADHADLSAGAHDHYAFSFSEEGVWKVTFVASGTHVTEGELTSEPVTFTFVVGGSSAGAISLSQEFYTATQGDDAVTVTVVRSDASQHAEVTLTTADGPEVKTNPPFFSALAGRDYTAPAGEDTHVHFEAGEFSKMVTIPLLPPARAVAQNRHFVVTLSDPEDGATLGTLNTAVVRILAEDTRSPTLSLSSPGTKVSSAIPLAVTGKAGDAFGIDRVEVALNDEDPVLAVLGSEARPNSVPFTAMVTPQVGTNTITVTAYDLSGNTKQITRTFEFSTRYRLSIQRVVPEALAEAGDKAGSIKVSAKPGSAATVLMPKDANAALKTSDVLAGAPVVLTATAKKGYTFSHWENLPDGALNAGASASFDMPEADVSVTAVFIENPFASITGAGTGFQGLILPDDDTVSSNATTGYLTGTLNPASGAFSGQVMVNGQSVRFVAAFNGDGSAFFRSGRSMLPALAFGDYEMTLEYQVAEEGHSIAITLTSDENTSSGSALRGRYSRTARVPAALLNSASRGFYTLALPAKGQEPALATNLYPQGTGFAILTLDATGGFRYTGVLADGSKITGSSLLTAGDVASLFVQLVTPGQPAKVKGGSFGGELAFDATATHSDVSGLDLFWFRPAVTQVDRPAAAASATRLYTDGWPQGVVLNAVGALYDARTSVQEALNLREEETEGNAELVLDQGKLTEEAAYAVNIVGKAVKKLDKSDKSFQLKLAAPKGGFSGTFTPDWASPAKKAPAFQGVILQKGNNRGGYGFFISNADGDNDPESGRAYLGSRSVSE